MDEKKSAANINTKKPVNCEVVELSHKAHVLALVEVGGSRVFIGKFDDFYNEDGELMICA